MEKMIGKVLVITLFLVLMMQSLVFGDLAEEEIYDLDDFENLYVEDAFNVNLYEGDYKVTLKYSEGFQDHLDVYVKDKTLYIGLKHMKPLSNGVIDDDFFKSLEENYQYYEVAVYMPDLKTLDINHASSLYGNMDIVDLCIKASHASHVEFEGSIENLDLVAQHASFVDLSDCVVEKGSVIAEMASSVSVQVEGELDAEARHASSIDVIGQGQVTKLEEDFTSFIATSADIDLVKDQEDEAITDEVNQLLDGINKLINELLMDFTIN